MHRCFDEMKVELPGYAGAGFGTLDGRAIHVDGMLAPPEVLKDLAAIAESWARTYDALGGAVDFGSNDEVLISATKGYVILRVHHPSRRFLAVALGASGNIGYLRFRMRGWLRALTAEAA